MEPYNAGRNRPSRLLFSTSSTKFPHVLMKLFVSLQKIFWEGRCSLWCSRWSQWYSVTGSYFCRIFYGTFLLSVGRTVFASWEYCHTAQHRARSATENFMLRPERVRAIHPHHPDIVPRSWKNAHSSNRAASISAPTRYPVPIKAFTWHPHVIVI